MAVAAAQWTLLELAPNDLVIDRTLNPRLEIDAETVEHYMEVFDQLPPIEAFDTGRGRVLVDGWHRHAAGKALRRERIPVRIRTGPYREAMEYAALANLSHGKPLTTRERSRAAETVLKLHPDWSDPRIASLVGFSQMGIFKMRQRLVASGQVTTVLTRVGANGVAQAAVKTSATPESEPEPEPDPWAAAILEGDAFDVLAALEDASADLLFVDPPYGILGAQGQEWDAFASVDGLMTFTRLWLEAALPKLKPTGRLFVCFSQWHVHRLRALLDDLAAPDRFDLLYSNTLIWHYKNILAQPNDRCELKLAHEPVLYYRARHAPPLDFSVYGEEQGDVWEIATPQSNFKEGKHHPAQKPLELLRRIIALGCPRDGLVLDPFAGSGTTGVAAYELGRTFRLIEKDPGYAAVCRRRLDEAAGPTDAPEAEVPDAAGD